MVRRNDSRERLLQAAIARWLDSFARSESRRVISERLGVVAKSSDRDIEAELLAIFTKYGAESIDNAVSDVVLSPEVQAAIDGKQVKIQLFDEYRAGAVARVQQVISETRQAVNDSVGVIVQEALGEYPQPTTAEIARRIRRTFHGDEERNFVFSPDRAELIARTEMVQTVNNAAYVTAQQAGADGVEWFAYKDGRSGKRHHELMDGKRIRFGGEFENEATGARLRFPGDPRAPISETANCRCSLVPWFADEDED